MTPRSYSCGIEDGENSLGRFGATSCSAVVSISFNNFIPSLFLAALTDGSLYMYRNDCASPITVWTGECMGLDISTDDDHKMPYIVNVEWSKTRPAIFFTLDRAGVLHSWNLIQKQQGPISSENPIKSDDGKFANLGMIKHFSLTSCPVKGVAPKMFLGTSNGEALVYEISSRYAHSKQIGTEDDIKVEIQDLEYQISFFLEPTFA